MPRSIDPRQGEIWDVNFDPQVGREQGGFRPALVISSNEFNDTPNGLVIVVPITSTNRGIRLHVPIDPPDGGLTRASVLMCDQIRAQSTDRLVRRKGTVPPDLLRHVQTIVRMIIAS